MVDVTVNIDILKTLVGYEKDSVDLQLFADQGKIIVDNLLSESVLSSELLNSIALYMAGHLYVVSVERGGFSHRKSGESEARMRVPASDKLSFLGTRFGQQSCALDISGVLLRSSRVTHSPVLIEAIEVSANLKT